MTVDVLCRLTALLALRHLEQAQAGFLIRFHQSSNKNIMVRFAGQVTSQIILKGVYPLQFGLSVFSDVIGLGSSALGGKDRTLH